MLNSFLRLLHKKGSETEPFHTCLSYQLDKIFIGLDFGLLTGMVLIDLQNILGTKDNNILLKKYVYSWFFSSINCLV